MSSTFDHSMHDPDTRAAEPRRFSLRWLIPALSAVILSGAIAVFGSITYRFARSSALETAAARLETVAEAFAQPVQPGPAWARLARGMAASQGVLDIVRTEGHRVSDGVGRQVAEFFADTSQSVAVDIRGPNGGVLFSMTSPRAEAILSPGSSLASDRGVSRSVVRGDGVPGARLHDSLRLVRAYPDTAFTSDLYLRGGHVLYERAVPIRDGGRVIGHLVEVRKLSVTPATRRQLERLVGTNATLIVGNDDGSLWFNLTDGVTHTGPLVLAPEYWRDGRRWLSAAVHLPAAPWTLSVEFPVDHVLAPVKLLGRRLFAVGVLVVLIGVSISERLSRKLTTPLARLTVAAEGIAGGDRVTRGFELNRGDEIGRLSRAFAVMADSIRESHDTLEHTIGDRTSELQAALLRLRETQEELLRKERLATLGQLSSSIAHELRNPLSVMTNALFYLDTVLHDAPPKVQSHLAKLRAQVRLSESIIRGLLDSTRATPGNPVEVNVAALIDDQLGRVDVPPFVRVERIVPPDLRPVRADPVQVGQVLINLFNNAVQAMEPTGGVLRVEAFQDSSTMRISVADTGPGIPKENRARVFEPLFTTKARGIGLGLSVSRTLTQANGGQLTLEDNRAGGARFVITLPSPATAPETTDDPVVGTAPAADVDPQETTAE